MKLFSLSLLTSVIVFFSITPIAVAQTETSVTGTCICQLQVAGFRDYRTFNNRNYPRTAEEFDALVDATHPMTKSMPFNATKQYTISDVISASELTATIQGLLGGGPPFFPAPISNGAPEPTPFELREENDCTALPQTGASVGYQRIPNTTIRGIEREPGVPLVVNGYYRIAILSCSARLAASPTIPTNPTIPEIDTNGLENQIKELNLLSVKSIPELIGVGIRIVMGIIGSIALLILIYAGFLWMTAAGNSSKEQQAMKTMLWGGMGVIIILSSYAVVQFIFNQIL